MILTAGRNKASVMPIYRRMCRFNVTVHLLILFTIHKYPIYSFTTLTAMQESEVIAHSICRHGYKKRAISGKSSSANGAFVLFLIYNIVFLSWLLFFLLCSGDVHQNPGPSSTSTSDTTSSSSSAMSTDILALLTLNTICHLFITMFKVFFLN